MFEHILIATDGSPLSGEALEKGFALARALNARVTVVTAVVPFYLMSADAAMVENTRLVYEQAASERAEAILKAAADAAGDLGITTVAVRSENPWEAIVNTATERGCDVIAMASHGRRGLAAFFIGSETSKVLAHSKVPVLVFR